MSHAPAFVSARAKTAITRQASLRVVPVPVCEPPYDDERGPEARARGDTHGSQHALALSFTLPSGVPAVPETRLLQSVEEDDPHFGPQHTSRRDLPDPRSWSTLLSQAFVEVLAGHRPVGQLLRWTTAQVYTRVARLSLNARGTRTVGRQARAVVRSVHVCEPVDGVAEACALVTDRHRSWALALRLEGVDGRWRCTVLELV